ncbi:MAG: hypothetical protein AB1758_31865 [Candidatus Eremiobacterota bacterium]
MIRPPARPRAWVVLLCLVATMAFVAVLNKQIHDWYRVGLDTDGREYWVDRRSVRHPEPGRVRFLLRRRDPATDRTASRRFELDLDRRTLRALDESTAEPVVGGTVADLLVQAFVSGDLR